jgi:DNA-binding response OmpR family regulator
MSSPSTGPSTPKKLILVIEDDPSVRMLLEKSLSGRYQVELVVDGLAALKRLVQPPVPDLIICDIMMPGADGLTVARRAKTIQALNRTAIIFLTAKSTPMDVIAGIQAGARHYMTKPFKIAELLDKVNKVLKA